MYNELSQSILLYYFNSSFKENKSLLTNSTKFFVARGLTEILSSRVVSTVCLVPACCL